MEKEQTEDEIFKALDEDEFELFDDVDEVPEETPPQDGDQHDLVNTSENVWYDPNAVTPEMPVGAPRPRRRVVPYCRELKRGKTGKDVRAVQRALKVAQRKWKIKHKGKRPVIPGQTALFGPLTVRALKQFQKRKGLKPDGVYGKATHKKLAPFYDAYGIHLMHDARQAWKKKRQARPKAAQLRCQSAALYGYNNRHLIRYTMSSSRMYGVRNGIVPPRVPYYEDCSSFAKWTYYVAKRSVMPKLPDPDGLNWSPWGYTGTLARHGKWGKKQMAALGFYGSGTFSHVVVSVGYGSMCVSHGSDGGPYLSAYNYRGDFAGWKLYPGMHY